ncbi:MAG: acyltransferase [Bacteroidota bacterium]
MKIRFTILDSFRGLFAFIVAIYHFKSAGPISQFLLIQKGLYFVDFFFVLSGFIINHTYAHLSSGTEQWEFMKNRFFRLYPLHFIILIVCLGMELVKYVLYDYGIFKSPVFAINNFTSFITNVLFVQSFNITSLSWNYPSWSISAEMVAYVVFCLSIVYIKQLRVSLRVIIFMALSMGSLLIINWLFGTYSIKITASFGMFRCMFGFFIGCIVYELYRVLSRHLKTISLDTFTVFEIAALLVSLLSTMYLPARVNFLLPLAYAITILCFAFEKGKLSQWLSYKFFITMGKYSYSIYMVHAVIAIVFEITIKVLKIESPVLLSMLLIVYLVTVFQIAALTHKYIEVKLRQKLQPQKVAKLSLSIPEDFLHSESVEEKQHIKPTLIRRG